MKKVKTSFPPDDVSTFLQTWGMSFSLISVFSATSPIATTIVFDITRHAY